MKKPNVFVIQAWRDIAAAYRRLAAELAVLGESDPSYNAEATDMLHRAKGYEDKVRDEEAAA